VGVLALPNLPHFSWEIKRRRTLAPKKRKRSLSRPYTTGELNRTVDALLHPLAEVDPAFLVVDGILHGIIEQNPPETVLKFIHHSLPKLLPQLVRKRDREPRGVLRESTPR